VSGPQLNVKSFDISKRLVFEAWEKVRANAGAPGVDTVTITEFASKERANLYKLWNRMSSGSYFPGPVRAVEIPKDHGAGVRVLGVPNTADRIAQTAAARLLEVKLEPIFHPDSYGYRPGRSAHDALAVTRKRCWKQDWILDLDIRAFFDSVPHDLLLKAVAHHTDERWVLLYIERWLNAPMLMPDGTLVAREKGTPQGSPISPLIANLFMHYAFDRWMDREYPGCPFERYADDIVAHCDTEEQARVLRAAIASRLGALGLELHPDKTKVVYCKDGQRRGDAEHTSFDFLGYTFRARRAHGRRGLFVGFLPAMSQKARKAVGQKIRAWHLNRRTRTSLSGLARDINPPVRGWINFYGAFYRSELYSLAKRIDEHLVRWAMQKFKRLRGKPTKAWAWLDAVRQHQPRLFAHWHMLPSTIS
jgi:RNA-directed DNA polymerase